MDWLERLDHAENENTKAGFLAILGAPNAGKSTLMNAIVGEKLAIVCHKIQTTRMNVRGIYTTDDKQFVFTDTPGIHDPRRMFDAAMVEAAWRALDDADIGLLLIDAKRGFDENNQAIIEKIKSTSKPLYLVINKIDEIKSDQLISLVAEGEKYNIFKQIFPVSALNKAGIFEMMEIVGEDLPQSPFLYDADEMTDASARILAAEITREKVFHQIHEEVPYQIAVETVKFEERDEDIVIEQNILVEREGLRKIVLGAGGEKIKRIGSHARKDISKLMGVNVHLFLKVKVKEWSTDYRLMEEMGLDKPKDYEGKGKKKPNKSHRRRKGK